MARISNVETAATLGSMPHEVLAAEELDGRLQTSVFPSTPGVVNLIGDPDGTTRRFDPNLRSDLRAILEAAIRDGGRSSETLASAATTDFLRGNLDRMVTDTRLLLIEGLKLATKTFAAAKLALGWVVGEMDEFVIHQVSRVHTDAFDTTTPANSSVTVKIQAASVTTGTPMSIASTPRRSASSTATPLPIECPKIEIRSRTPNSFCKNSSLEWIGSS